MIALSLLFACGGDPATLTTMEGFGFGWQRFNHRLSYAEFDLTEAANIGIVGGTSTTGEQVDVGDSCDPDTCQEFPFADTADVRLDWAKVTSSDWQTGSAETELVAGATGASVTLEIPVEGLKGSEAVAVIQGFSVDTDHLVADGLEHCYNPRLGWHPRRLAVSLGDVTLGEDSASVEVFAAFEAGNSLEEERVCVDAIRDQALAMFHVRVAVIAGDNVVGSSQDLGFSQVYAAGDVPFDPDPQPEPGGRPLTLDGASQAFGFSSFDWAFHTDDVDHRGAYLRTLEARADTAAGVATGHATNYSPATQLSGFDYTFAGKIVGISGEIERGSVTGALPAAIDVNLDAVVTALPLE